MLKIAAAVGIPLKIDVGIVNMYQGPYARVLVYLDIYMRLPDRFLPSLKVEQKNINFVVSVIYEQLPKYHGVYRAIGHGEMIAKNYKVIQLCRQG